MGERKNTEGMYTTDLAGHRMTKESIEAMIAYAKEGPHEFKGKIGIYYYEYKGRLLKYDSNNHEAYFLNDDKIWEYSQSLTDILTDDPGRLPRKYSVYESYETAEKSSEDNFHL